MGRVVPSKEAKIKARGWTIEIYRSVGRVRDSGGRADDIARRRAAWKFYQYRGGHLVSLAVAREKLRAELRTIDRECRRSTNRRGLPGQAGPGTEAIDEQHVSNTALERLRARNPKALREDE